MKKYLNWKFILIFGLLPALFTAGMFFLTQKATARLLNEYYHRQSVQTRDKNNKIIALRPNYLGYYADYIDQPPTNLSQLLLKKEDKYFYYHPGVNPISALRAVKNYLLGKPSPASSTITQQLVKILLAHESQRTLTNKLTELVFSLSLEINLSKKDIIKMYYNSIFLGNGMQGIKTASRLYFDRSPEQLTEGQFIQLLAALTNPTNNNPLKQNNLELSKNLLTRLKVEKNQTFQPLDEKTAKENFNNYYHGDAWFEIASLGLDKKSDRLTIDQDLTKNLRQILKGNLTKLAFKKASNGAIVVIKFPENELLAMVGSPDPLVDFYGYKINMAVRPRSIGSTIKPFIYLKGFEKNLRPYTLVDDKEYKYNIGTGFAFYPKNYDYQYRGKVTLHYALANSLNVPTVKVLEYVGLDDFYNFMENDLEFKPVQNLKNYQLGIALGELEMDLTNLAYYFSIFANHGQLKPLVISRNQSALNFGSNNFSQNKKIGQEPLIELVNKILSDRLTGMEQFGLKSNLNLANANYAVKTGTSKEFRDSWTIGYTPDFLVGVWVGNSDNSPMDSVSGQKGAGDVWHEAMNLMMNSNYNHKTAFNFKYLKTYDDGPSLAYGLKGDNFAKFQNLLSETKLIQNPHDGDIFLFEKNMQIPFNAAGQTTWSVNEKKIGQGEKYYFSPSAAGQYKIKAEQNKNMEEITIYIKKEEN